MPKKGGLGLFTGLRGALARERRVVFLRGVETTMHTMIDFFKKALSCL